MTVESSEWKCDSGHQLYTNLLDTSKNQANAYRITDLPPNVAENDEWNELFNEIASLNRMRRQVRRNALEAMETASDGRIFSDLNVIDFLRNKSTNFEDATKLSEACLLAQRAERLTNAYVENARARYAQFLDAVVPTLDVMKEALKKLTDDAVDADWTMKIVDTTKTIHSISQRMQEEKDERTSDLKRDIEKMAMHLDDGYQEIYQGMVALRDSTDSTTVLVAPIYTPEVQPDVELTTSDCDTPRKLYDNLSKASKDLEKISVNTNWQPKRVVIEIDPYETSAQWYELLKTAKELNDMRNEIVKSALEAIKNVTDEKIKGDMDAVKFVDEHLTNFENSNRLAAACSLAEKGKKLTYGYVKMGRVRFAQFIESALPNVDAINGAVERLSINSVDGLNADWNMQVIETIKMMQSSSQQTQDNVNRLINDFMHAIEDMARHVDYGYEMICDDLEDLCDNSTH